MAYNNAIFPHFDEFGLCGFELKISGFTAFAKGGKKNYGSRRPCQPINGWSWPKEPSTLLAMLTCFRTANAAMGASLAR
jgi:hypothetical protein